MNSLPRIEELEHRIRNKFPGAVFMRGPNNDWLHVVMRCEKPKAIPVVEIAGGLMQLEYMENLLNPGEYVCYAQTSCNMGVMTYSLSVRWADESTNKA